MDTVISSMLAASAPYLGQERLQPEHVKIAIVGPADVAGAANATRITESTEPWVQTLARHEHDEFSGEADPADER